MYILYKPVTLLFGVLICEDEFEYDGIKFGLFVIGVIGVIATADCDLIVFVGVNDKLFTILVIL